MSDARDDGDRLLRDLALLPDVWERRPSGEVDQLTALSDRYRGMESRLAAAEVRLAEAEVVKAQRTLTRPAVVRDLRPAVTAAFDVLADYYNIDATSVREVVISEASRQSIERSLR